MNDNLWPQTPSEWSAMWKWMAKQYRQMVYDLLDDTLNDLSENTRLRERLCDAYATLSTIHDLVLGDAYATNTELIEAIRNLTQCRICECARADGDGLCGGCREAK